MPTSLLPSSGLQARSVRAVGAGARESEREICTAVLTRRLQEDDIGVRAIREQFYAEQRGIVRQQEPVCLHMPISHAVDGYPDVSPDDDDGDDDDNDGGESTENHAARSSAGTFNAGAPPSPRQTLSPAKHAMPMGDTPPAPPLMPVESSHQQQQQHQPATPAAGGLDPGVSGTESDYGDEEGDEQWSGADDDDDDDDEYEDDDVLSIEELDDAGKDEKYRYAFAQTAPSDPTEGCKHYRRRCQKRVRTCLS